MLPMQISHTVGLHADLAMTCKGTHVMHSTDINVITFMIPRH